MPFKATKVNGSERTIRVTGSKTTHQEIVDALCIARGSKYVVYCRDPAEAAAKEEKASLDGDDVGEMLLSIRALLASGSGVADGVPASRLDNGLFDFLPESTETTFGRLY